MTKKRSVQKGKGKFWDDLKASFGRVLPDLIPIVVKVAKPLVGARRKKLIKV